MKIISKKTKANGEPKFTLEKFDADGSTNIYILSQYNDRVSLQIEQTNKGFWLQYYLCATSVRTFLSNADIIIIK